MDLNKKVQRLDSEEKNNQYETCVCCHKKVNVLKNKEIEFRSFYIEGAGQLCYDCFQELYIRINKN